MIYLLRMLSLILMLKHSLISLACQLSLRRNWYRYYYYETGANNNGSEIDLQRITDITGISSFNVTGDLGANIIQLSIAVSTGGKTTVDLGGDNVADSLIFIADKGTFSGTGGDAIAYTTVDNFKADKDKYGLYYTGFTGDGTGKYGIIRSEVLVLDLRLKHL